MRVLNEPCEIVEFALLSEPAMSVYLRFAAVESFIIAALSALVWQLFALGISGAQSAATARLKTVSRELDRLGGRQ